MTLFPILRPTLVAALTTLACAAQAQVITFDTWPSSFVDNVPSYTESGFTLSSQDPLRPGQGAFNHISNDGGSNGWITSGTTTLTANQGEVFNFSHIDIRPLGVGSASYDFISFWGQHADGLPTFQSFVITPPGANVTGLTQRQIVIPSNGIVHLNFETGFNGLTSLSWSGGAHYVDNIGVNLSGTTNVSPVPEPETYALMLAGLGFVGWTARRRAKRAD